MNWKMKRALMWWLSFMKLREILVGIIVGIFLAILFWSGDRYATQPKTGSDSGKALNIDFTVLNAKAARETVDNTNTDEVISQSDLYKAYSHVNTIVFFIGYPRSRHSLLGSLLDAHPHMVISDETMAFNRWKARTDQWMQHSIYAYYDTMFSASHRAVSHGRRSRVFNDTVVNKSSAYGYHVPNQWQGRFDTYIEIIGDKSGAFTAGAMTSDNGVDAVHLLEKASGAQVKFVHVVRNPFDNIATMTLQHRQVKGRDGTHETKINAPEILDEKISQYFSWAEGCNKARISFPGRVLDIPSMEIVKGPADTLRKICAFLQITCSEDYIQDCANTVDPVPSITRDFVEWTENQKKTVYEQMKRFSFFEGYSFDKSEK